MVSVGGFWIDRCQVTNAEFARFVAQTGYVTVAERPLDPPDFPGAPAENLVPGSLVFTRTAGPVDLRHLHQWWTWTPGPCWRHPEGPGSRSTAASSTRSSTSPTRTRRIRALGGKGSADRGGMGVRGARRPRRRRVRVGRRPAPRGEYLAQLVAGRLPLARTASWTATRAWRRSARSRPTASGCTRWPATSWEWTGDWYALADPETRASRAARRGSRGAAASSYDLAQPLFRVPRKVIKGGSYLCADSYSMRYRPAARRPQMIDTGMSQSGFAAWSGPTLRLPEDRRRSAPVVPAFDLDDTALTWPTAAVRLVCRFTGSLEASPCVAQPWRRAQRSRVCSAPPGVGAPAFGHGRRRLSGQHRGSGHSRLRGPDLPE